MKRDARIAHPVKIYFKSLGLINAGVMGEVPKAFKEPLEIVDTNTTVLINLRNVLLDVQKLNSGHIEYDFKPVMIGDLIKEFCVNIWGIANELKIQIVFNRAENDNHGELGRIKFLNVLSIAIKFSPAGEVIEVKLDELELL